MMSRYTFPEPQPDSASYMFAFPCDSCSILAINQRKYAEGNTLLENRDNTRQTSR